MPQRMWRARSTSFWGRQPDSRPHFKSHKEADSDLVWVSLPLYVLPSTLASFLKLPASCSNTWWYSVAFHEDTQQQKTFLFSIQKWLDVSRSVFAGWEGRHWERKGTWAGLRVSGGNKASCLGDLDRKAHPSFYSVLQTWPRKAFS